MGKKQAYGELIDFGSLIKPAWVEHFKDRDITIRGDFKDIVAAVKRHGPGFYSTHTDTILVEEFVRLPRSSGKLAGMTIRVSVWNTRQAYREIVRNMTDALHKIVFVPHHEYHGLVSPRVFTSVAKDDV